MTQAARIKQDPAQVRDEARIEAIVARVREQTLTEGGDARRDGSHLPQPHGSLHRLRTPRVRPPARARHCRERRMKLLMVDNYDSFTYNIVQYFGELGAEVECSATTKSPWPRSKRA